MSDNEGIVFVERRVTGERTARAYAMNRSRAKLEDRMTNSMMDAERDIERAYKYKLEGNGWPTGGQGGGAESFYRERDIALYLELNQWLDDCDKRWSNVVIDMTVNGSTANRLSQIHGNSINTIVSWYLKGLNEYCVQRGWGDQFKV